jgi:hypothetical protein
MLVIKKKKKAIVKHEVEGKQSLLFNHEDGGDILFRIVSGLSLAYTALYPTG